MSVCLSVCLCLCLSLSHTHTHTILPHTPPPPPSLLVSGTRWWDMMVTSVGHDGGTRWCCSGTRWLLQWRACGQRDCGSDGRRQLLPCWPAGQDFCPRISCYFLTVWPSGQKQPSWYTVSTQEKDSLCFRSIAIRKNSKGSAHKSTPAESRF